MSSDRNTAAGGWCWGRQGSLAKPRHVPVLCPCFLASEIARAEASPGIWEGPSLLILRGWELREARLGQGYVFCFTQNSNICLSVRPPRQFCSGKKSFTAKERNDRWAGSRAGSRGLLFVVFWEHALAES